MTITRKTQKTVRRIPQVRRTPKIQRTSKLQRVLHLEEAELRTLAFICTLALAGLAIYLRINDPVVWTFLGVAIGRSGLRGN